MNILIVEDDAAINNLLAEILRRAGYRPMQAYSGTEAGMVMEMHGGSKSERPGLVIMDLMLPGMTGEELLPVIRKKGAVPVLVLSARDTPGDKTSLLRAGADDYMTKPFDDEELLARIEALLRRAGQGPKMQAAAYKDIELDQEARIVTKNQQEISLTAREFAILELLMSNPHKVFTKANIYESVWNDEFYGDDNTVNVHVSNLRSKLGEGDYIQTVWGIGFKLFDLSKS